MTVIIQWIGQNIAPSIAIFISLVSLVVTIVFNRKERPNIMPYGQNAINGNHLILDFLNTSQFSIHNLTILVNGFDNQLNEISPMHFFDKFLFSIGEKTTFCYSFNLGDYAKSNFYFRIRFYGKYQSRFPIFPTRKFKQAVWYSAIIIGQDNQKNLFKISTTHKDEIEKLEARYSATLKNYEKTIDKKFSS